MGSLIQALLGLLEGGQSMHRNRDLDDALIADRKRQVDASLKRPDVHEPNRGTRRRVGRKR